jgi:hypothetical protein
MTTELIEITVASGSAAEAVTWQANRLEWRRMATDYDAPRKTDEELAEESLEELKARRADKVSAQVDVDETELAESLELPGADLSAESLTVRVVPKQADEFTCSRCFLVHHRSQLVKEVDGLPVCSECA